MARLAVNVTVTVFFFVIALSHARIPADLTENDFTNNELFADLTESDPKTATNMIFLPSHKSESEPEDVEVKHAVNEPDPDSDSSESKTTTSFEHVTVINFRPINRQFPRRPSFLFRHRRPCRHHAMRKAWGQGRREVSYGNDMLTTASDGSGDSKAERLRWYRGDGRLKVRQIPARWVNFHDGDVPKFGFRHEEDKQLTVMKRPAEEDEFKRPRHDNHGHHHHHHHHHDDEEEGEEHEHKGGFLKKIRKFLTHF
ncbi:hypothetical protein LWI28_027132 [Acer negundo]|uniref:Uncharacterized protein n=1 Tax=Acer negundo TaxID=4023 RepID=A0AAD5ISQ6_ACENE|nr:hypothetical protein LWI28_027132 [Acer negundo]KAK4845028.1 hypothetical protein QYF36_027426 [Acer negundo]